MKRSNDMKTETSMEVAGSAADAVKYAIRQDGVTVDQLEKLLLIEERYRESQAKQAFHKAVAEFKKNPPKVTKDKKNAQYKSMYTTLGNLVNTVNPELSKQGLSASWEIKQNGTIEVTCILTHSMGHSERTSASAPADISGSKNAIQQIKSTITYLKAVTFESICGLASTDANLDDDGNATGDVIDKKQLNTLVDLVADKGVDMAKFCSYLKVEDLELLPKAKYEQAVKALEGKPSK